MNLSGGLGPNEDAAPLTGGCACGRCAYRLEQGPLFVHACHCTQCQRLTGSAFALNALIEADCVISLGEDPIDMPVTGASGRTQHIYRCRSCAVALWSTYPGAGPLLLFVRVGTLDRPDRLPPDLHIFTSTRLPWLGDDIPAVAEYYSREQIWPAASLERIGRLFADR